MLIKLKYLFNFFRLLKKIIPPVYFLKKSIIILCLATLICNAVYKLPVKTTLTISKENSINSYVYGYKYSTLFNVGINKLKDEYKQKETESVGIWGAYFLIDYPRLIFHSILIVILFGIFYLIASLKIGRHRKERKTSMKNFEDFSGLVDHELMSNVINDVLITDSNIKLSENDIKLLQVNSSINVSFTLKVLQEYHKWLHSDAESDC